MVDTSVPRNQRLNHQTESEFLREESLRLQQPWQKNRIVKFMMVFLIVVLDFAGILRSAVLTRLRVLEH